ncbi:MAG TPA: hypothetical protein PLW78_06835 [bacterium]|nr:hypothetical protein [bacterium]HRQ70000.1 hypothetical protein [bacterium]
MRILKIMSKFLVFVAVFLFSSCGTTKMLTAGFENGKAKVNVKETQIDTVLIERRTMSLVRNVNNNTYYFANSNSVAVGDLSVIWFEKDGQKEIKLETVSKEHKKTLFISSFDLIPDKKIIFAGRVVKKTDKEKAVHTFVAEYDWTGKLISEKVMVLNNEEKSEWVNAIRIVEDGFLIAADYVEEEIEGGFWSGTYDFLVKNSLFAKLNTKGDVLWNQMVGANQVSDSISGFDMVKDGYIIYGTTEGDLIQKHSGGQCVSWQRYNPDAGIYVPNFYQCNDLFIMKFDFDGNKVWASQIGKEGRKNFEESLTKFHRKEVKFRWDVSAINDLVEYTLKNHSFGFNNSKLNNDLNQIFVWGYEGQKALLYSFSTMDGSLIKKDEIVYEGYNSEETKKDKFDKMFTRINNIIYNQKEGVLINGIISELYGVYTTWPKYFFFMPLSKKISESVLLHGIYMYPPFFINENESSITKFGYYGNFEYILPENAELTEEKFDKK